MAPVIATWGAVRRRVARSATSSWAHPVRTRYSASTVRANPPTSARRSLLVGPQQQHLAGVRVGRPRLGVQVVAVVPHHHQAQVGTGANAAARVPTTTFTAPRRHREEGPVARGRAGVGGEHDVLPRAEDGGQGGVDPRHVLAVRHAQQRPAPGREGGRGGLRQQRGPGGTRQRRPDRPGRLPRRQPAHEGRTGAVARTRPARPRPGRRRPRGRHGVALLGGGVPARDGQPQHVGAGAGVAGRDQAGEPGDGRGQHRLGADRPAQRRQPALVLAAVGPLQDEAVHVLAGEPDLDPGPGHHLLVQQGRHQVVEGPVEVREGHVDQHPGDRALGRRVHRGGRRGRRPGLGLAGPRTGQLGHQRQLARGVARLLVAALLLHGAQCSSRLGQLRAGGWARCSR